MAKASLRSALQQMSHLFAAGAVGDVSDAQLLARFADRRDELAFSALLERHGPMVLGVCRGVLRDPLDVEDAFQATFLVLVRKARSLWVSESLGGWLHRVAYRVAVRLSVESARKRARQGGEAEAQAVAPPQADPFDDVRPIVHEELARLPERYRAAVVLCYLSGMTQPQAAARLGCGEATVRRRLAKAKGLLHSRLTRRGIAPAGAIVAGLEAASAQAVTPALRDATLRSASAFVAGRAVETTAASLAAQILRGTGMARIAVAVTVLATLGAAVVVAARDEPKASRDARTAETALPSSTRANAPSAGPVTFRGRVVNPSDKPVMGAKVYLNLRTLPLSQTGPRLRASSGADGAFRFDVARSEFDTSTDDVPWSSYRAVTVVPGYGVGVTRIGGPGDSSTLKLVEDLPITGRVIDLQGRPVAGASIRPFMIQGNVRGNLTRLLDRYSSRRGDDGDQFEEDDGFEEMVESIVPAAVTDADGQFRLTGIGRERMVLARVEGPSISTEEVWCMTRHGAPIAVQDGPNSRFTIYGAEFVYVAAPSQPIVGMVTDLDTKEPLSGVEVQGNHPRGFVNYLKAVTDAQGRFRLSGLPAGQEAHLSVDPAPNAPYLRASRSVKNPLGERPTEVAFVMKKGLWIEGKVTERGTGRPCRGQVSYFAFTDNPHGDAYRQFASDPQHDLCYTAADGSYRVVGLPGHGLVAFRANTDGDYAQGVLANGTRPPKDGSYYSTRPGLCNPSNFNALGEVVLAEGAGPAVRDLEIDRGQTVTVRVTDPEGQPVTGYLAIGTQPSRLDTRPGLTATPEFEVVKLLAGEERRLTVLHLDRKLAGGLTVRGGEPRPGPLSIQLATWGVVTGRLLDAAGHPLGGVRITGLDRPRYDESTGGVSGQFPVGQDGQFRIGGLVPGRRYTLGVARGHYGMGTLIKDLVVNPGQTRDLGDRTIADNR